MKILFQMLVVKGVFLVLLGGFLAWNACEPITGKTINDVLMFQATIVTLTGVFLAFGSWMALDTIRLNERNVR